MTNDFKKKKYEKLIFSIFLESLPLKNNFIVESIKNCDPPEPDITCLCKDNKRYYFELVRIEDEGMAKKIL